MNARQLQSGYTLVEALIAVAILAGVASALAPMVFTSIKAAARINSAADEAEISRVGDNALSGVVSAFILAKFAGDSAALVGEPDSIELTILLDQETGPQRIRLHLSDGRLLLTPPRALDRKSDRKPPADVVLSEGVRYFRYYGAMSAEAAPDWHARWSEPAPPLLVELVFENESEGKKRSQSFVFANRAPLHCAFDQVSRQCRE